MSNTDTNTPAHAAEASPSPLAAVVYLVGVIAAVAVLGIIVLTGVDKPVPDALATIAVSALTGLLGLIVNPKR